MSGLLGTGAQVQEPLVNSSFSPPVGPPPGPGPGPGITLPS